MINTTFIEASHPEIAAEKREKKIYPCNGELRSKIIAWRDADGMSSSELARQVGYSSAVISMYLADEGNTYPADTARLERRMADWLRSAERRRAIGVRLVSSDVTRQVCATLELIRRTNDVGVIFGPAGAGKTCGITMYGEENPTCLLITIPQWALDMRSIEGRLFDALDRTNWKHNTKRADYLVEQLAGTNRLIIIDNAHKLTRPALQWLFDFHDATRCPIALIGNSELMDKVADNDQRFSRVGIKHQLKLKHTRVLIKHLVEELAPDAAGKVEDLCEQVADQQGRFRAVEKQLKLAREIHEGAPDTAWDRCFRAAHERLFRNFALA